jgi:isopentenyl-diphosphate delta-isomerase
MGFSCALSPLLHFTYRAPVGDDLIEHEYDHVFVGVVDGVAVRPNPDEVADWRWASARALRAAVASDPAQYTAWFRRLLDPVLADASPAPDASVPDGPQNG